MADDRTLDELRLALAPEIARAAVFDGWTDAALAQSAAVAGIDPAVARLAFPGGAMDMIAAWIDCTDAKMQAAFGGAALAELKIRERIRTLRAALEAGMDEGTLAMRCYDAATNDFVPL